MQIETKNGNLFCVEVPMEATEIEISAFGWSIYYKVGNKVHPLEPKGDFYGCRILGTITNGVLDFDAEPYVDSYEVVDETFFREGKLIKKYKKVYKNYVEPEFTYSNSTTSFLSLLTSKSIPYTNKKIVCLKIK